jgi:hypothetical protein
VRRRESAAQPGDALTGGLPDRAPSDNFSDRAKTFGLSCLSDAKVDSVFTSVLSDKSV